MAFCQRSKVYFAFVQGTLGPSVQVIESCVVRLKLTEAVCSCECTRTPLSAHDTHIYSNVGYISASVIAWRFISVSHGQGLVESG